MVLDELLDNFDASQDIYKLQPQLKLLFSIPSIDLWSYFLIYHPKSIFASFTKAESIEAVQTSFNPMFTEDPNISKQIISLVTSKTQKFLQAWESKFEERIEFIDSLPYIPENIDTLEKLMANTDKIFKQYLACVNATKEDNKTLGGRQESASELGVI